MADLTNIDVCTFSIKIKGNVINYPAMNISITNEMNKVPTATLTLLDNDPKTLDETTTDTTLFDASNDIEILAAYANEQEQSIFKGTIVKHTLKVTINTATIVVSCKHDAVKMTTEVKNNTFKLKAENSIIEDILTTYSLKGKTIATMAKEEVLIQKSATDWDFVLLRADSYGYIVMCDDTGVNIIAPGLSSSPLFEIIYGINMLGFNADIDAEKQLPSVKVSAWNVENQAMDAPVQANEPSVPLPDSISWSSSASKLNSNGLELAVTTSMTPDALQKWADSILLRMRLSSYRGTISCYGSAKLLPGSVIKVTGVGPKFSGNAFVSMVTHTITNNVWKSELKIGIDPKPVHEKANVNAPPAAGQVPAVNGLQIAKVKQLSKDPDSLNKILVELPTSKGDGDGLWARFSNFYATNGAGLGFLPEVGDEVVVGFLESDPRCPIIIGSLYSQKLPPLNTASDEKNNIKTLTTRSLLKITFDDDKKTLKIETPAGNSIFLNDDGKTIEITDQNSNSIKMSSDGITLNSNKNIELKAGGDVTISATGKVSVSATKDAEISGMNVSNTAQQGFTAKGNASAELSASGQTTIKGAMVMIN